VGNIVKFIKAESDIEIDSVGIKAWETMCNVIDQDFHGTGFGSYANQFKGEFKPIFEALFIGPLEFPAISDSDENPLHKEWKDVLSKTLERIHVHTMSLVKTTYIRELERFCELNFS